MQANKQSRIQDGILLFCAALLIGSYSFFVSRHRILWSDELFGWMLVTDPSWRHMLRAWELGADGGGAGFYILCRLWLNLFGHTLVVFREFSAFWIFVSFACMWLLLRRSYRLAPPLFSLPVVWFASPILLWHMVQTRFYGFLLGACAANLLVLLRSTEEIEATGTLRSRTLVQIFIVQLFLVSSHPFGFAYSALILLCADPRRLAATQNRISLVGIWLSPWAVLLVSLPALRNSQRVGKPWFWTTRPTWGDLQEVYRPTYHAFVPVLLLLVGVAGLRLVRKESRAVLLVSWRSRKPLLRTGCLFVVVPVVFWLVSLHGTSYFVDRYFCPFLIGVAILGSELLQDVFPQKLSLARPLPFFAAAALAVFLLRGTVVRTMLPFAKFLQFPGQDFTGDLAAQLPRDLPVVFERADMFDLVMYYRGSSHLHPIYLVDWPLALSPQSPRWMVSADHEMENWKAAGFYPAQIGESRPFLQSSTHFAVVGDSSTPWFEARVHADPRWHVRRLGSFVQGMWTSDIWDVSR